MSVHRCIPANGTELGGRGRCNLKFDGDLENCPFEPNTARKNEHTGLANCSLACATHNVYVVFSPLTWTDRPWLTRD